MHKHCACRNILYVLLAYLGLCLGGSPRFLQQKRLCVSSWTEHLSVHTTSSNSVTDIASSTYFSAKAKRFALLASRISWQYALPLNVHPSDFRQQRTVNLLILYPREISSWWSWIAVISSIRFPEIAWETCLYLSYSNKYTHHERITMVQTHWTANHRRTSLPDTPPRQHDSKPEFRTLTVRPSP